MGWHLAGFADDEFPVDRYAWECGVQLQQFAMNFLLTDTLGSVVSSFNNLPNGAAVVLGDQVYGPYGNRRVQQGTISTSKGFTGQFTDFVAGLDYYGARYYDPVVGVFVSADTMQGNAQGMNPYGYVGGNPETATDPTGNHYICDGDGTCGGSGGSSSGEASSPPIVPINPSNLTFPSLQPDACTKFGCNFWANLEIPTTLVVSRPVRVSTTALSCFTGFCSLTQTSVMANVPTIYRGSTGSPFALCTLAYNCYDKGGSGKSKGSWGILQHQVMEDLQLLQNQHPIQTIPHHQMFCRRLLTQEALKIGL